MSELYHSLYSLSDRVILSIWCIFCIISGLIGNALTIFSSVLISSRSGVDHFTSTILRNLAVSDLLYIFSRVLPALISHLAGGWALGGVVCRVEALFYLVPVLAGMGFIFSLTCVKVIVCSYPLRAVGYLNSSCFRQWLVAIIWVQAAVPNIIAAATGVQVEINTEIETVCEMVVSQSTPVGYAINIVQNIQMWVPSSLIIPCNVVLWIIAWRYNSSHQSSQRKAVTTVLSISLLFFIAWIPTVVEQAWRVFGDDPYIPLWFNKAHINVFFISVFGNPLLYALNNRRFRASLTRSSPKVKCACRSAPGRNFKNLSPVLSCHSRTSTEPIS